MTATETAPPVARPGPRGHAFGTAALAVAVPSVPVALLPLIGLAAVLGALVAAGLAIAGLVRGERRRLAVAALVTAVVAAVTGLTVSTLAARDLVVRALQEDARTGSGILHPPARTAAERASGTFTDGRRYELRVESTSAQVVVSSERTRDGIGVSTVHTEPAPFAESDDLHLLGPGRDGLEVAARALDPVDGTVVTCSIAIDGVVVVSESATGADAVVCTATDDPPAR